MILLLFFNGKLQKSKFVIILLLYLNVSSRSNIKLMSRGYWVPSKLQPSHLPLIGLGLSLPADNISARSIPNICTVTVVHFALPNTVSCDAVRPQFFLLLCICFAVLGGVHAQPQRWNLPFPPQGNTSAAQLGRPVHVFDGVDYDALPRGIAGSFANEECYREQKRCLRFV